MNIKNKKNKANYVNFKASGVPKKILIPAGKTANIPSLLNESQIVNTGDFLRGFLIVIEETKETKAKAKPVLSKASKKKEEKETETAFDKIEKEVKAYTDNK